MSQELQLGKYEFHPYEFDAGQALTMEELSEMLRKAKAKSEKDVETPSRSISRRRHRGNIFL